jgi:hypothetical protein
VDLSTCRRETRSHRRFACDRDSSGPVGEQFYTDHAGPWDLSFASIDMLIAEFPAGRIPLTERLAYVHRRPISRQGS